MKTPQLETVFVFDESMIEALHNKEPNELVEIKRVVSEYVDSAGLLYCTTPLSYWTSSPFDHANALANHIAEKTSYSVLMKSLIPHVKFQIQCDSRYNVEINALDKSIFDLEEYVKSHGVSHLLPEIELIRIYNKLYSLESKASWTKLLEDENALWLEMDRGLVRGGVETIEPILLRNFGTALWKRFDEVLTNIIWITTDMRFELMAISMDVRGTIAEVKKIFEVSVKEVDYKISPDYRERKYVVYAVIGGRHVAVLTLFNNAEYELIPMVADRMAHPYVVLKFLLVSLFTQTIKMKLGKLSEGAVLSYKSRVLSEMRKVRIGDLHSVPCSMFGIHYPARIAIKEKYREVVIPPYNVRQYYEAHGEYRIVEHGRVIKKDEK